MLAHYGAVADVCRVADPNRKGTVENAIQHTQSTALKGRKFESLEAQNQWLSHWEERWAAPRIHGRKKRQVLALFEEERAQLRALPSERFRMFRQVTRGVDDAGCVQADGSFYAAGAPPYTEVAVRIFEHDIEVLDEHGQLLRRHEKSACKGAHVIPDPDRIFNPSRQTAQLLAKAAKIGPHSARLAAEIFARLGRPGQRAIYGMANLARHYSCVQIESACEQVLRLSQPSYQALKRILERTRAQTLPTPSSSLQQDGAHIRCIDEYQAFWDYHTQQDLAHHPKE
jgi:hypothetical protein